MPSNEMTAATTVRSEWWLYLRSPGEEWREGGSSRTEDGGLARLARARANDLGVECELRKVTIIETEERVDA